MTSPAEATTTDDETVWMDAPDPEPTPPPASAPDAGAPWGRRADGTPRRKPGPGPGRAGGAAGSTRRASTAPPPRRNGPRARVRVDYRPAILGVIQLPAAALAMAALRAGDKVGPVLTADAAALTLHGPAVAEALDALAQDNAAVATVLEKILTVGPYGAILAAGIPLVLQLLCNHGIVPVGMMGTLPVEDLVRVMQAAP